ncbi:Lrp/AsnC family transcriptional regulator [Acidocella aminolytica]|jgi:DNA-binding Lrp family transcriptional regulator|uniref:Transcriptional regulator AsnC n=1 Tax=Acidocella aminolytica 101 = DSM 11237 TaxID=1120923 RepID=A0A0D6PIL2_9PROT|nr:Lrp/AsnC family transcriptional regulator [Acidocella aminolytica]GAN81058.1 transcriptional regulator AsnC [Acidocella aminolytica 101 = DSM 11237]GBQ42794.1 transcriptional regulator [Acidocella aminolytica 101 = DSM 11237]SHF18460.1 DNA-binding transcriptional regulator, Lrp family [Acidocella aminolytica 101 = DSM 11237]
MDDLDRALIAELRINGRASVPQLAAILGVARGTVQRRLDRLIDSGEIKGFTIQLRDDVSEKQIRAFMIIEMSNAPLRASIAAIKRVPGLVGVYDTNGTWDLIAEIEVSTMPELNQVITAVRGVKGVLKSQTFIMLGLA